ncbi:helix-turn-helix transcriptional regulator [Gluconobacter cerinus]|uniref:LexA family protein n=1 Tax=Gluconobacter cerinus TaxID=38307 RepID=UPI00193FEE1D|nr:S24 family peptidase [Gluconobacter cerinus]MBM3096889.1 helix-turn-helix transcriptional regulator [Gluconobacter cerinus]
MSYELLLARIKERLDATGMSERKACITAGVGLNTIRHMRARGHAPKPANLQKLAVALGVNPSYFLDVAAGDASMKSFKPSENQEVPVSTVFVKGAVQAGLWQEALEWSAEDWKAINVPADDRYLGVERFGLLVRGSSMNRVYPEGSIAIAVRTDCIGRMPRSGERVVVLKRGESGLEATIKKYEEAADGRRILWPESYDPAFQTPVILDDVAQAISQDGHDADHGCALDLEVIAIVVGSYRPE